MTRLLSSYLIFLAISLFSCKSRSSSSRDTVEIAKSYGIIHGAFATTKRIQEDFFAKATEALATIKYDQDAIVDTKQLRHLLDSAKVASRQRIEMLSLADEVDDEFMYKEKGLKYVSLLDTLYNNEFNQFADILDSKAKDRFQQCQTLLLRRMQDMKKAMYDCHDAGEAVREKYNIKVSD